MREMTIKDALSMEACGFDDEFLQTRMEIAWNLEQSGVLLPVHCTLMTISALLHPYKVHLGNLCLPLHCDGYKRGK